MSGFSINWLDLREPADQVARNKELAAELINFLQADAQISQIIVDLGSGTGSTLRALTSLGSPRCVWRLVDHDPALLNEALRRHGQHEIVEDYEADLSHIDALPLGGATLLSASALFDLVPAGLVDRLLTRLQTQATVFYSALNYNGLTQWTPEHPLDASVLAAFNQDQRRDKGMGPALGPDAAPYLQSALERADFSVRLGDSPWQLGPDQQALVEDLIRGIHAAVADGYGLPATALADWLTFRLSNAATGHTVIGHTDVLAFPSVN